MILENVKNYGRSRKSKTLLSGIKSHTFAKLTMGVDSKSSSNGTCFAAHFTNTKTTIMFGRSGFFEVFVIINMRFMNILFNLS